jgi:hypothetical protein
MGADVRRSFTRVVWCGVSEGGAAAAGRPCRGCFLFARPGTVRVRRGSVGGRTAGAAGASEVAAVYEGIAGRLAAMRLWELLGAGDSKRELRCSVSRGSCRRAPGTEDVHRTAQHSRETYRGQEQPRGRGRWGLQWLGERCRCRGEGWPSGVVVSDEAKVLR